jgi:hypothetical protein
MGRDHTFSKSTFFLSFVESRQGGEAGLSVDNALVSNFMQVVSRADGISPVDIAIGILSLANFAQRRGQQHIGNTEYQLAGGAEGLLRSFVQQKIEEEVPDAMRGPLLKGIVLSLVDLSKDQRLAEGATASTIASRAEVSDAALRPWLERLTHPRIRLLEKPNSERYRLPHERLVPVLRQLIGTVLASLDRMRLVFEDGFARWSKTGVSRNLLAGKELRHVLKNRSEFLQGEDVAQRTRYLVASVARRNLLRGIACVLVLAIIGTGLWDAKRRKDDVLRGNLKSWNIPPELLEEQDLLDSLDLSKPNVNDLAWLHRDVRLKELNLAFTGSSLKGIENLKGLKLLTLNLDKSSLQNLEGLEKLTGLTSLDLYLGGSRVQSLAGLEKLTGLTWLLLDLSNSDVQELAGLEKLTGLKSLSIVLSGPHVQNLAALEKLTGLTSLILDLAGSRVQSLAGLEKLTGLTSLDLNLTNTDVQNLAALDKLTGLTSLSLRLYNSHVQNLADLEKLTGLKSLDLNLANADVQNLAGLEELTGLTSLSLNLVGSHVQNLADLEKLTGLKSLDLNLAENDVQSLAGLEKLTGLTSLSLYLYDSRVQDLAELEKLAKLETLELQVPASLVLEQNGMKEKQRLTKLTILVSRGDNLRIPGVCKSVGVEFEQ